MELCKRASDSELSVSILVLNMDLSGNSMVLQVDLHVVVGLCIYIIAQFR